MDKQQNTLNNLHNLLNEKYTIKKGVFFSFLSENECQIKKNMWEPQELKISDSREQGWVKPFFSNLDGTYTLLEMLSTFIPKERQQEVLKIMLKLNGLYIEPCSSHETEKEEIRIHNLLEEDPWLHFYEQKVRDSLGFVEQITKAHVVILGAGIIGTKLALNLEQLNIGHISVLNDKQTAENRTNSAIEVAGSTIIEFQLDRDKWLDWLQEQADSISLIIVAIDEFDPAMYSRINAFAVSRLIPWSILATEGWNAYIGPTFFPKQTGCFTCYIHQKSQMDNDFGKFFRAATVNKRITAPPINPVMAQLATSIYCINIPNTLYYKKKELYSELTIARQLKIDLLHHKFTSESIHKYLSCPTCGKSN